MLHNFNNIVLLLLVSQFLCSNSKIINGARQNSRQFPKGFLFGTATASYQVEGAWDSDGKSENIWDHFTHNDPCRIRDCSNGDIANDSYNKYKRDVEMTRELGLDFYRFSLSWPRILPSSFPDKINEAGVQYYNNLIDELLKYNIEPMVTIYHWDLPQKLQEMGGWTNPHIVDWYVDYARVVFEKFGDRIKYWITINEPREICYQGYGDTTMAPALNIKGVGEYLCAKNLLVAHAKVYRIYEEEFKPKYGGLIGITLSGSWTEPESEKYVEAADDVIQFEIGIYAHPIFSATGDFPPIMKEKVAKKSADQGFYRSRLPEFTKEEIVLIQGSSDFFGLNHYSSNIAYKNESIIFFDEPSSNDDLGVASYKSPDWSGSASSWLKSVPWGFYKLLKYITDNYNNPNIIITENGFSTYGGLEDEDRITYFREYLDAMLDAIEDGSNVTAYTAWSLMDNFEWMQGYVERFGLYEVDYSSPNLTRTPRKSAFVYKNIISTRALNYQYEPDTTVMSIDEGH